MAKTLNTNFNFPNIGIYNVFNSEGNLLFYEAIPNEGYVMYCTTQEAYEEDEYGNLVPVTYYYTCASLPLTYNFSNFSWVAVLRSEVDENYIFGGGDDNNHEVM